MSWTKSTKSNMAFTLFLMATAVMATPGHAQDGKPDSKPKPNIAVTGCLKREGYGGVAVTDAKIDAIGDGAATATPGAGKPSAHEVPPKWVLDHAASYGQHVGEKVQVIGVSSWVEETKGGSQTPPSDEVPSTPHIDVQAFKVLADSCS